MNRITVAIGMVAIGSLHLGKAAQIEIGDFSGSENIITFDSPIGATTTPIPYQGVVFTPLGSLPFPTPSALATAPGTDLLTSYLDGNVLRDYTGYTHLLIDFDAPVNRVGMTLANGIRDADYGWDLIPYDSSLTPLGTIQVRPTGPDYTGPIFSAFEFSEGISRVEVREWGIYFLGASLIDNLHFEAVPEPTAAQLVPVIVGALVGTRLLARRKTRK